MNKEQLEQEQKINQIISQTNYTEEQALIKLNNFNGNHIEVIKEYLGIKPKAFEKNKIKKNQINQEIFKQIRTTMDESMRKYREDNPINMEQVVNNLRESEDKKNTNVNDTPI